MILLLGGGIVMQALPFLYIMYNGVCKKCQLDKIMHDDDL